MPASAAPRQCRAPVGRRLKRPPVAPTGPLLSLLATPAVTKQSVPLVPGFRIVVYTDGFIETYGTLGGLDDQEVIELVRRGVRPAPEWLNARWPGPLRDDIAAVELAVPTAG